MQADADEPELADPPSSLPATPRGGPATSNGAPQAAAEQLSSSGRAQVEHSRYRRLEAVSNPACV